MAGGTACAKALGQDPGSRYGWSLERAVAPGEVWVLCQLPGDNRVQLVVTKGVTYLQGGSLQPTSVF